MATRSQLTERLGSYLMNRSQIGPRLADLRGRAFPDRWSVMLGQVAVHSFILVLISGVFLMLFYDPSMERVVYNGSYGVCLTLPRENRRSNLWLYPRGRWSYPPATPSLATSVVGEASSRGEGLLPLVPAS
jgi:hypothetical protein